MRLLRLETLLHSCCLPTTTLVSTSLPPAQPYYFYHLSLGHCGVVLSGLVHLAAEYCDLFHVTLVPEKTKLIGLFPPGQEVQAILSSSFNPISIAGLPIPFTDSAEHVGILRSTTGGNMPHILSRITAHQRALQGVLHCGLARGHRGNIASGLRLEKIYGAPVLLSGTAALVLSTPEITALHQHYKCMIKQLLKLPSNVPESFAMLLAGSLPITALLHLGMLTLLGMISRLGPGNILHKIGRNSLLSAVNSRSWFIQVRLITQKYNMADPLLTLQCPPTKAQWKSSCRAAVTRWWLLQYRGEASHLDSMVNFKYNFFSLSKPHRTLTTANSSYEVQRACTVALMLSGQYNTDYHRRWWSPQNPQGHCRLCTAPPGQPPPLGTLSHQLLHCPSLQPARDSSVQLCRELLLYRPQLQPLFSHYLCGSPEDALAFLVDPSSCSLLIAAAQCQGGQVLYQDCHYVSRVWCHSNHKF